MPHTPIPKPKTRVPTSLGDISFTVTDFIAANGQPARTEVQFKMQIRDADGIVIEQIIGREENLEPGEFNQQKAFMTSLRARNKNDIFP